MLALAAWAVIPVADGWAVADINVGILYLFAISSLGVYGVIMAGWASNSKYRLPLGAALGRADGVLRGLDRLRHRHRAALRRLAQPHRDRARAGHAGVGLFGWYWLPLFPMFIIFFVSALAETNRPPFDLGRGGIGAGRRLSWSNIPRRLFLLQFLGEYVAILTMCALTTILFLGGWLSPIPFPPFTWMPGRHLVPASRPGRVVFMFSMVKAFVPRYRYDQLMRLGWKVFLPISLVMVVRRRRRARSDWLGRAP